MASLSQPRENCLLTWRRGPPSPYSAETISCSSALPPYRPGVRVVKIKSLCLSGEPQSGQIPNIRARIIASVNPHHPPGECPRLRLAHLLAPPRALERRACWQPKSPLLALREEVTGRGGRVEEPPPFPAATPRSLSPTLGT